MLKNFINKITGNNPSPYDVNHIKRLIDTKGALIAGEEIRNAAENGNLNCQIFMSTAGLYIPDNERSERMNIDTEHYTRLAAESGDANSQFNLAKLYIRKMDTEDLYEEDLELLREARQWLTKAGNQGLKVANVMLNDFKCYPD